MLKEIETYINKIRQEKPLILNLTNFVTMDFVANCQLALGASPIMTEYDDDLEELVKVSNAIYVNIGSISENFIKVARHAADLSKRYNQRQCQ